MKKKIPSDVIFQIIHTEKIGIIGVVFTPIKVWQKTGHFAKLRRYDEFDSIFKRLELYEIEPSIFEHTGNRSIEELEKELLKEGFLKDNKFSLFIDIEFSYGGLSNNEIMSILKK
jgi:hypothetical protein